MQAMLATRLTWNTERPIEALNRSDLRRKHRT